MDFKTIKHDPDGRFVDSLAMNLFFILFFSKFYIILFWNSLLFLLYFYNFLFLCGGRLRINLDFQNQILYEF